MSRALLLSGLVALAACERPTPPPVYELHLPLSVPDGTEVVVDGKVIGAFTDQKARVQLPKGVTLEGTKSLAIRLKTACGHVDRSVAPSGDTLAGRKDAEQGSSKQRTIQVALEMDGAAPARTTIWVDPETSGEVKVGSKVLGKGPNRILLADCDDEGRRLTVGEEHRGAIPAYDPSSRSQLFIPASTSSCYALHTHVYDEGRLAPDRRKSVRLAGKPFYEMPLVSFFLREAPETIEAIPGSPIEEKKELTRIDCDAPLDSAKEDGASPSPDASAP